MLLSVFGLLSSAILEIGSKVIFKACEGEKTIERPAAPEIV
jgi:hypothetical protein